MSVNENENIMTSKLALPASESSSNDVQFCWICFTTSTEDTLAEWVHAVHLQIQQQFIQSFGRYNHANVGEQFVGFIRNAYNVG